MTTANIQLPDSVTAAETRALLAIKLFELGRVSCGQAAEMAGFSKRTFMELLGKQRVAIFGGSADEVARDLANHIG